MSSKNLSLFFDCVYVLNKDASQISRINLLNLLLIRQHLMNRQLMFQLQVTTLKMNHRNSRLKQLHQHLRQHHLLTTQRTKRVQTQTIKYQKKTEQLHYVETQSFFYGRKNLKFKFCLHYHHIQIEVDDSVHSCLQIRSHQLNLQESYLH